MPIQRCGQSVNARRRKRYAEFGPLKAVHRIIAASAKTTRSQPGVNLAWSNTARVTSYDLRSIWKIDMGDRYGRSDTNRISKGISIWDMRYRSRLRYVDMVIYHIDMVILDSDMGYGLIWEVTVSIWSSSLSICDNASLCALPHVRTRAGSPRSQSVPAPPSRGFHSSTCQLTVSTFCGTLWINRVVSVT